MTAGGIWAPLVGTFCLVFLSLLRVPRRSGSWRASISMSTRGQLAARGVANLAVVNLAGVPSIVHGLFGVGAFVYFCG